MDKGNIINITPSSQPVLWIYENGMMKYRKVHPSNWIFVSGDSFDLDFLASQLDMVENISYEHTQEKDIYGSVRGLKVSVPIKLERSLIDAIGSIGAGRKYRVYNGLIDPGLKIMSMNNLQFFQSSGNLDYRNAVPSLECHIFYERSVFSGASFNGNHFSSLTSAMDFFMDAFKHYPIIIYNNTSSLVKFLRDLDRTMEISIPHKVKNGNSFMSYGRVNHSISTIHIVGKISIPSESFMYSEGGLSGIMEISNITGLAPETVTRVTPGTAVSSMENYDALRSGFLVVTDKDDHEMPKPIEIFMGTDKGGYVMQPYPGLYENVYEFDFSSLYPSIMHHFNMSPETIGMKGPIKLPGDNPYYTTQIAGFMPHSLDKLLKRRLTYKYNKSFREDFRQRDKLLKWLLVTSFGYTGFKNARFGKIEVHEAITSVGRWALQKAVRISEKHGFKVIHGIVDSIFVTGRGDVESVLKEIRRETSINIVMDGHYRWLVILPARSGLGALNRYYGLKYNGEYKVRGIGMRRSDTPLLIIRMQEEILDLLQTLDPGNNLNELWNGYNSIREKYLNHLGNYSSDMFGVGIRPSKYRQDYGVDNIQKATMVNMEEEGTEIMPGESVRVVINDFKKRVLNRKDMGPDRKFYRTLMERNLEPFDFLFSCLKKSKNHNLDWWFEQLQPRIS